MTITEETRQARVMKWTNLKRVWEYELAAASGKNDIGVAEAMITEAEAMIKRLEIKGEVVSEVSDLQTPILKSKTRKAKRELDASLNSKVDTRNTGL